MQSKNNSATEVASDGVIPREDRKEEALLDAASAAFLELGFAGASMDLVAQRARASKTTLYSRFPSKEALFAACIERECLRFGMGFDLDALAGLEPRAALIAIARAFLNLVLSPIAVRLHQILMSEGNRFPEMAQTFMREGPESTIRTVEIYLQGAVARGQLDLADPHHAARAFLGMLHCMEQCELALGIRPAFSVEEIDRAATAGVDLFLNGARPRGGLS